MIFIVTGCQRSTHAPQRHSSKAAMTTESVVNSFVRAIEHHHILENSSDGTADYAIVSSDLSSASEHRELLEQLIRNLDDAVIQVGVRGHVSCQLTDQIVAAGEIGRGCVYGGV